MADLIGTSPIDDGIQAVLTNEPENPAFESPQDSSELTPDSVFEDGNPMDDFFRTNQVEEKEASPEDLTSPVEVPQEAQPQSQEETSDNETVRYQYWQSEADKARNENSQLKQMLSQQQSKSQQQAQQPQEAESEAFPPPPPKPQKPSGFTREEAYTDPSSDSSKYLDTLDNWRDNMDDYNRLHQEYNLAVIEDEKDKMTTERNNIQRAQAEREAYSKNMGMIQEHLSKQYNATPDEVKQFVTVMDNPDSINVDNLFQLFRLQTGVGTGVPVSNNSGNQTNSVTTASTASTEKFDQMKRAQQVPSPMGVLPSQSGKSGSNEDSLMDSMISDFNKRNPW